MSWLAGHRRYVVLVVAFVVLVIIGCGGGGSSSSGQLTGGGGTSGGSTSGSLGILLTWPDASRSLPAYAKSVIVTLSQNSAAIQSRTVDRSGDSSYDQTLDFTDVPVGSVVVQCTARSEAQGAGMTVATFSSTVFVKAGTTTNTTADFTSTVAGIVIDTTAHQLLPTHRMQLSGHAVDKHGGTLSLPSSAFEWSIVDGKSSATITTDGLLTSTATPGLVLVRLTDPSSGHEADTNISVTPNLTGVQTAFVYLRWSVDHKSATLFRATTDDPSHPVLLRTFSSNNVGGGSEAGAIDPVTKNIVYRDPFSPYEIRCMTWDGGSDHLLFTDPNLLFFVGFLPDGKFSYFDNTAGPRIQMSIDVLTGNSSPTQLILGHYIPDYRGWNGLGTEFLFSDGNGHIYRQPINSFNSILAASGTSPEYAPDGTILTFIWTIERFAIDGTDLGSVNNSVELASFCQAGNKGVLGAPLLPSETSQLMLFLYGNPNPINMAPGAPSSRHVLLDAIDLLQS